MEEHAAFVFFLAVATGRADNHVGKAVSVHVACRHGGSSELRAGLIAAQRPARCERWAAGRACEDRHATFLHPLIIEERSAHEQVGESIGIDVSRRRDDLSEARKSLASK